MASTESPSAQTEGELLQKIADLEQEVSVLHAQLHAKSQFLATMSHELRTPISAILGMTALALEGEVSDEQRQCFEIVKGSTEALLCIINDVLDFTKLEAGKIELVHAHFDVRKEVESRIQLLSAKANERKIRLRAYVARQVPEVLCGDARRFGQILINLVGNALKFSPSSSEVQVNVDLTDQSDKAVLLHVRVRDSGAGIPREKLEQIFEPFYQLPTGELAEREGSGLGLAISARLSEVLGGEIWVESEPGCGSVFHFTVTMERVKDAPKKTPSPKFTPEATSKTPPLRILLAEDNPANQLLLLRILQHEGHQVMTASNGKQAVDLACAHSFDLVLMDVEMPVLNGYQATAEIRAQQAASGMRTPIWALTAHVPGDGDEECTASGMDAYLTKPVDRSALRQMLRDLAASHHRGLHDDGRQPISTRGSRHGRKSAAGSALR
jgi:two-component system, sensor histidine kinase